MADIVNGKKIDRKKDLYNHVSFNELYAYNRPIMQLHELSKRLFTQYISTGVDRWKRELDQGYTWPFCSVKVENYRNPGEVDEFTPQEVCFSMIEIVDPYDVVIDPAEREEYIECIRSYIDLGMYPLVSEPMGRRKIIDAFEKYDNLTEGRYMNGTIVECLDIKGHFYGIVMWDPIYPGEMTKELIETRAGTLRMRDMIATPDCWKDPDSSSVTNFGIPVFEYTPMRMTLAEIVHVEGFADYINEAVVTGNLKLDFVDRTLKMANQSLQSVGQALESVKQNIDPIQADVPVEDAAESDDFGHRLRLYDEAVPDEGDDDDDDPDKFFID